MRCRVAGVSTPELAKNLLDNGASQIVVTTSHLNWAAEFPQSRIAIEVTHTAGTNLAKSADALAEVALNLVINSFNEDAASELPGVVDTVVKATKGRLKLTVAVDPSAVAEYETSKVELALSSEHLSEGHNLADAFCASLTSDRPDGLWSTVIVDERLVALGFAFSSADSVRDSISKNRGVYQSRKRGLWEKGATSGNHQDLIRVGVDCDRDCLIFVVRQHGPGFCHRDTYTCFGERRGLDLLGHTLESRMTSAPEGSYTKRLFNDDALLKSKLIEEAVELAEATTQQHVAEEAADLLYFALACSVKSGVRLADIEHVLDNRHLKVTRRPGNAKPEFIKAHMKPSSTSPAKNSSPLPVEGEAKSEAPTVEETPAPTQVPAAPLLTPIAAEDVPALHRDPVDAFARGIAEEIMADVSKRGEVALRYHAERLGDVQPGESLVLGKAELKAFYDGLGEKERGVLDRTAERIRAFAKMQRDSVTECEIKVGGGAAGQQIAPVEVAGCYAPGGRYPLPSSVLMGVVTARVAGVPTVWVASPHPDPLVCAAAHTAGADGLLMVGGAQAIAAFAHGAGPVPVCDAIVGPGNRFVTAAKSLVAGAVAIDMLAGPSECLVIADESADPTVVAADLLAQAEHDTAARAILVTTSELMAQQVETEVSRQLQLLPTEDTARAAIEKNSFSVLVKDREAAADVSNRLAPEHLEVHMVDLESMVPLLKHWGALFLGNNAAEVLGDYGAGPNHTLPTGGTARSYGGLSVHTFLRQRTWLRIDNREDAQTIVQDAVDLALCEGLHGHSRAAALRLPKSK